MDTDIIVENIIGLLVIIAVAVAGATALSAWLIMLLLGAFGVSAAFLVVWASVLLAWLPLKVIASIAKAST